jgi:hypothetical protein
VRSPSPGLCEGQGGRGGGKGGGGVPHINCGRHCGGKRKRGDYREEYNDCMVSRRNANLVSLVDRSQSLAFSTTRAGLFLFPHNCPSYYPSLSSLLSAHPVRQIPPLESHIICLSFVCLILSRHFWMPSKSPISSTPKGIRMTVALWV